MIEQNRVCIYIFHAAPGVLWRRERHQTIKDIRSCCFTATGSTTYLPPCSSTALQGLPPIFVFKSAPSKISYLSSASTTISSDRRKPHRTMVKTTAEGDKCSAFCPPTPFSARHPYQQALSTCSCYWPSQSCLPGSLHSLTQRTSWIANFFSCFLHFHLSFQMYGAPLKSSTVLCCVALRASP